MDEPVEVNQDQLAKQLWALGDSVRLRLLKHLPRSSRCEHGNNVSQLAEKLGLSQPTISHHLRILRQTGLVLNRKMCRDVYYWVNAETADQVLRSLQATLEQEPVADDEGGCVGQPEKG